MATENRRAFAVTREGDTLKARARTEKDAAVFGKFEPMTTNPEIWEIVWNLSDEKTAEMGFVVPFDLPAGLENCVDGMDPNRKKSPTSADVRLTEGG